MKKSMKRFAVVIMALCLTFANLIPAAAQTTTANPTIPTVENVTTEAQKTAKYLMDSNIDAYSDMDKTSPFYNASRNLFLAIRSGYDCSENIKAYTTALNTLLDADGTVSSLVSGYYVNDVIACQAYAIITLKSAGFDPKNFNRKNLVSGLSKMLENTTVDSFSYETSSMNPYYLGVLYTVINTYSNDITNSTVTLNNLFTTLISISNDRGVIFWGNSADNNAWVLSGYSSLYSTNTTYKTLVTNALADTKTNFYDSASGATLGVPDYLTGLQSPSPDSTALALYLYGSFNESTYAATTYNALITFASTENAGAFTNTNDGSDIVYATQDALVGLVSYQYALSGINNVFDTSKTINFNKEYVATESVNITLVEEDETSNVKLAAFTSEASVVDANGNKIKLADVQFKPTIASSTTISNMNVAFSKNNVSISDSQNVEFYDLSLVSSANKTVKLNSGKVRLTFSYKDGFDSADTVLVYHLKDNGELELIPVTADTETFSFETDGFSPYAFIYEKATEGEESVQTGDSRMLGIYGMLLAMSAIGIIVVEKKKVVR